MRDMGDKYDGIWNGHHDFRALGAPLDEDCLPNVIALCEDIVAGHYSPAEVPSFWGQPMPLGKAKRPDKAPPMIAGQVMAPRKRVTVRRGRNFLTFDPDKIYEEAL